nr:hypothetical protein [Tanacetum cinerariifolium]
MFELRRMTIPFLIRLNDYYRDEKKGSKEKDPGSFTLPCYINTVCFDNALADLGASVSVMPLSTYLNLGLGELAHTKLTVELADRILKYPKGIAENVLVGIGKFVVPLDFIILDMPEDVKVSLILGRPLLSTTHAKIDVFKRKITLRRDQVDDLMPTIKEGEVINEPMIDIIKTRNDESFNEYPSFCDFDQKIQFDCAYNLRFSCMIVVENMDGYRDQDMRDVIFGEPFYKASCVEARRFDGLITIHNGIDSVTYQMARSHPRFKHLSNVQCNKIKPLLKGFAAVLAVLITGASQSRQHGKSEPKTYNNDKNLSEVQLEHEKEDEFVVVVVQTLGGRGGESFWEGGDDFRVDVLRFHTCLTDILGFLEELEWWFEQDIDKEEERFEGDKMVVKAFQVTADVPEIYMQEFWATAKLHHNSPGTLN